MRTINPSRCRTLNPWPGLMMSLCLGLAAAAAESDVEKKVDTLLGRMTLTEKIGQMAQINAFQGQIPDDLKNRLRQGRLGSMLNEMDPNTGLEIQRIAMEESRLGIPLIMGRDVIHGFRTIFPIPLGQAAAWDPNAVRACMRSLQKRPLPQASIGPLPP